MYGASKTQNKGISAAVDVDHNTTDLNISQYYIPTVVNLTEKNAIENIA